MKEEYKREAALRLKVAAGHLESVRRMLDNDTYCVDGPDQRQVAFLGRYSAPDGQSTGCSNGLGSSQYEHSTPSVPRREAGDARGGDRGGCDTIRANQEQARCRAWR